MDQSSSALSETASTKQRVFQTESLRDARRCRLAMFSGRSKSIQIDGTTMVGRVLAVKVDESRSPRNWTINIITDEDQ